MPIICRAASGSVAICRALVQEPESCWPMSRSRRSTAQRIVMDALQRISRHFGLTVLYSLHSLDLAHTYCDRMIGMAHGRVVFDDVPAALTGGLAECGVMGSDTRALPAAAEVAPLPQNFNGGR